MTNHGRFKDDRPSSGKHQTHRPASFRFTAWRRALAMGSGAIACGVGSAVRLDQADGGSVAVMVAISLTVLVYGIAIALDLGNLYYNKIYDQRVADQSAIAAAFTYASTGSTATAATAAASLALANGIPSASDVTTTFGLSPTGDGHEAAEVVIAAPVPLTGAARMITSTHTLPGGKSSVLVGATSYAEIHAGTPCILALASPGIPMTGGTHIAATDCSVVSNNVISLSSGPTLTASEIQAVGAITNSDGTINGPQYPNSSVTADPYASSNVFARLPTVLSEAESAPIFPSMPSAPPSGNYTSCTSGTLTLSPGTNYGYVVASGSCSAINFSGTGTFSMQGLTVSGGTVTVNMPAGTYKIGDNSGTGIGFSGGSATFNLTGTPTLYLYGSITGTGSASARFNGTANWYISDGINDYSTGAMSFSNTGSTTSNFTVTDIVIGNTGPATFPNGTYTITGSSQNGGLTVNGTATFGNGSFIIEDGISVGGGKSLTIGGALSGSSVFEVFASNPGTSCSGTAYYSAGSVSIGSFNYFDICGQFVNASNMTMGSGAYTIYGEFDMQSTGGGTVTGSSVSVVASGAVLFGQGFSSITLDAPTAITSSSEGGTQTVAIASKSSATSTITQGATGTDVVGLIYLPNSPLTINGGGNLTGGGNCMQLIANSISMSGGGSITTNCSSLGTGAASGAVTLVE